VLPDDDLEPLLLLPGDTDLPVDELLRLPLEKEFDLPVVFREGLLNERELEELPDLKVDLLRVGLEKELYLLLDVPTGDRPSIMRLLFVEFIVDPLYRLAEVSKLLILLALFTWGALLDLL
jgi:hypothetical protein